MYLKVLELEARGEEIEVVGVIHFFTKFLLIFHKRVAMAQRPLQDSPSGSSQIPRGH